MLPVIITLPSVKIAKPATVVSAITEFLTSVKIDSVKIVVTTLFFAKTAQTLFVKIATLLYMKIGEVLTAPVFLKETDLFKDVIAAHLRGRTEAREPPDPGTEVITAAAGGENSDKKMFR
jgi:hypothetical protein